ncbi:MAG: Membrane protein, partial [uncultured Acetobacteraceae bacterium]
ERRRPAALAFPVPRLRCGAGGRDRRPHGATRAARPPAARRTRADSAPGPARRPAAGRGGARAARHARGAPGLGLVERHRGLLQPRPGRFVHRRPRLGADAQDRRGVRRLHRPRAPARGRRPFRAAAAHATRDLPQARRFRRGGAHARAAADGDPGGADGRAQPVRLRGRGRHRRRRRGAARRFEPDRRAPTRPHPAHPHRRRRADRGRVGPRRGDRLHLRHRVHLGPALAPGPAHLFPGAADPELDPHLLAVARHGVPVCGLRRAGGGDPEGGAGDRRGLPALGRARLRGPGHGPARAFDGDPRADERGGRGPDVRPALPPARAPHRLRRARAPARAGSRQGRTGRAFTAPTTAPASGKRRRGAARAGGGAV